MTHPGAAGEAAPVERVTKQQPVQLVSLIISPWSLKARWAMKHHKIVYKTIPYSIGGGWWLRWRLRRWTGRITVPVLLTSEGVLWDSFDISKWADSHSAAPGVSLLFPPGKVEEMKRWNTLCDEILFYGRQRLIEVLRNDLQLRARFLPPFLRGWGPLTDWIGLWAISKFASKYQPECAGASRAKVEAALAQVREALKQGGGQYLAGDAFSYADIVMAVALQPLKPVGPPYANATGNRPAADLFPGAAAEYQDLLTWRDSIFEKHFPLTEDAKRKQR